MSSIAESLAEKMKGPQPVQEPQPTGAEAGGAGSGPAESVDAAKEESATADIGLGQEGGAGSEGQASDTPAETETGVDGDGEAGDASARGVDDLLDEFLPQDTGTDPEPDAGAPQAAVSGPDLLDRELESLGIKRDGRPAKEAITSYVSSVFEETFGLPLDIVEAVRDGVLEPDEVLKGALEFNLNDAYDPEDEASVRAYATESLRSEGMSDADIAEFLDDSSAIQIRREAKRYLAEQQRRREDISRQLAAKKEANLQKAVKRREAATAFNQEVMKATRAGLDLKIGDVEVKLTPAQAQRLGRIAISPEAINQVLWGGKEGSVSTFIQNLGTLLFRGAAVSQAKMEATNRAADGAFRELSGHQPKESASAVGADPSTNSMHPMRAAIRAVMNQT